MCFVTFLDICKAHFVFGQFWLKIWDTIKTVVVFFGSTKAAQKSKSKLQTLYWLYSKAQSNIFGEFWECKIGLGNLIPPEVPKLLLHKFAFIHLWIFQQRIIHKQDQIMKCLPRWGTKSCYILWCQDSIISPKRIFLFFSFVCEMNTGFVVICCNLL